MVFELIIINLNSRFTTDIINLTQSFYMNIFKKLILIVTLSTLSLAAVHAKNGTELTREEANKGIVFTEASWAEILKKARSENKIIFFDAYTTWCGPCKMLQKNVFTRTDVGSLFNAQFINVKVDMESGEGPMLADRYPIQGYPTLFFINGDGKVVKQLLGYQKPEQLIQAGKSVLKK
jgi:thioredoxin 1